MDKHCSNPSCPFVGMSVNTERKTCLSCGKDLIRETDWQSLLGGFFGRDK